MPSREQYVAQRIGQRMARRGEPMILRRISILKGPVPQRHPPDTSADLVVSTGVSDGAAQAWLGITGSSVIGRLIAGDQILCAATPGGPTLVTWTVDVMPHTVLTDGDGLPVVNAGGLPVTGSPTLYTPDTWAAGDAWRAIPVSAPSNPDPVASIGQAVSLVFLTDQALYGYTLSFEQMTQLGWTETDTIGLRLSAYNNGPIAPPQVDDLLFVNGGMRAVLAVGPVFRAGVNLLYTVQAK
jgi:hypothetical protein